MSARKSLAWQQKRDWLQNRFSEDLQLRLLGAGKRGFIEFIPGRYAWRAIEGAEEFVVIHCLWVVGKSKGHGYATLMLNDAETWAKAQGYRGIAALTSSGNWLVRKDILARRGYESVDQEGPGFDLMVKSFSPGEPPRVSGRFVEKAAAMGSGLSVLRSVQCPYLEDAATHAQRAAEQLGLHFTDQKLSSAAELRERSPSPYGVFSLVLNGRMIASHYLRAKDIINLIGTA